MKIKDNSNNSYEVFAIYWIGMQKNVYFWDGFKLSAATLNGDSSVNVQVVDPSITWKGEYFDSGIWHWALSEDGFCLSLLEGDIEACQKFYKILRSEGFLGDKDLQRCRICGLLQDDFPWGKDDNDPIYNFCDCCGVVFGVEDSTLEKIRSYRDKWIASGYQWNQENKKPEDWLSEIQMIEIPFKYR